MMLQITITPRLPYDELTRRSKEIVDYTTYAQKYDYALSLGYARGIEAQTYALLTEDERKRLIACEIHVHNALVKE
jgi:hypothetical protein